VLSSRKKQGLDREAERLSARLPEAPAFAFAAHAGREADLQRLVDQVMERFGRIGILVNNAGTDPHFGPLIEADAGVWDKTFEVNLRGYFILCQLVYRRGWRPTAPSS
jgi:NAD(P)-dependent dehydrogenase (short-subunit alcohol dehydrogenase family)